MIFKSSCLNCDNNIQVIPKECVTSSSVTEKLLLTDFAIIETLFCFIFSTNIIKMCSHYMGPEIPKYSFVLEKTNFVIHLSLRVERNSSKKMTHSLNTPLRYCSQRTSAY